MANIMSQLKLKNNTSRNGFDLSRKNAFTAKIGELLPVACIECIPGDKVSARIQHFTRTMPVNTAAYTRIREYYDWFFVPTNLLWNKFNTFVTQMVDNNQHATGINESLQLTNQHPYFTCNQIETYINEAANQNNLFGFNRGYQTAKLLDYLGYGVYYDAVDGNVSFRKNLNLNPFPLLAYQKIYQDYYRNSQWENAYAPAFNLDYIQPSSLNIPVSDITSDVLQFGRVENMFDLRYCNWNKDLFMGLLPNSQYGDSASIINASLNGTQGVDAGIAMTASQSLTTNSSGFVQAGSSTRVALSAAMVSAVADSLGIPSLTVLNLRNAEALQRWREITQSQQQDYKNQIEAHFGVSPSDALSERCKFIDGSVTSLDISEVTNTNITGDYAAEIAGRGVGVGEAKMNFNTDVHGYLMCIYHAVPLLDYASDGVSRMLTKTMVTDYAIPEFDRTGMVQVTTSELTNSTLSSVYTSDLLGYAPRYYDYKTAVDEVHGGFRSGQLSSWVAPITGDYLYRAMGLVDTANGLTYKFFKVNPSVLNPIFAQEAGDDNQTDHLLVNCSLDVKAVRNLDRNGLPF